MVTQMRNDCNDDRKTHHKTMYTVASSNPLRGKFRH